MTNEQKYKTPEDRMMAFWQFCKGQEKEKGCLGCPTKGVPPYREKCALAWLALEAEEEKPLPCPFCGGEAKVYEHACYVRCLNCEVQTTLYRTSADAIAAWNRRAK